MKTITAIVAAMLFVALGVFLALALTGPKYKLVCPHNYVLADREAYTNNGSGRFCVERFAGGTLDSGDFYPTQIRRLGLFERAWYSLAGSRDTRD